MRCLCSGAVLLLVGVVLAACAARFRSSDA